MGHSAVFIAPLQDKSNVAECNLPLQRQQVKRIMNFFWWRLFLTAVKETLLTIACVVKVSLRCVFSFPWDKKPHLGAVSFYMLLHDYEYNKCQKYKCELQILITSTAVSVMRLQTGLTVTVSLNAAWNHLRNSDFVNPCCRLWSYRQAQAH